MLVLYPTAGDYKKGGEIPIITLPTSLPGGKNVELNDFQWWAYSKDFDQWLKANPRSWQAESVDYSKFPDWVQLLKESQNSRLLGSLKSKGRVSSFNDYLNEETKQGDDPNHLGADALKLHYAYQKLIADKKIAEEFKVSVANEGDDKAIFTVIKDPKTGNDLDPSLYALRLKSVSTPESAKVRIFTIDETLPGGNLPDNANGESLFKSMAETGAQVLKYGAAGAAVWGGLKAVEYVGGGIFALRTLNKTVKGFMTRGAANQIAKKVTVSGFGGSTEEVVAAESGIFSKLLASPTGVFVKSAIGWPYYVGKGLYMGVKAATFAGEAAEGVGIFSRFSGGFAAALEGTNPIGLIIGAVTSIEKLWNWFSSNQAPRLGEVDSFAFGNFRPKDIKIGIPITVCWTQEAGGVWGVLSFVGLSNDTRTTMEIMKIADEGGNSLFILLQVNSKQMQKELQDHELTLISFADSENFERGFFDNDDLELTMQSIDHLDKLGAVYGFKGMCDWNELVTAYQASSSQYLVTDDAAPKTYDFHFTDSEDNVINVSGNIVTSEDLAKFSDSDMEDIFHMKDVKSAFTPSKASSDGGGTEVADSDVDVSTELTGAGVSESHNFKFSGNLLEGGSIVSFGSFNSINEEDVDATIKASNAELAPKASTEAENSKEIELSPEQKSGPAKIAVYLVQSKEYADPKLRGKFSTGKFTNFTVPTVAYTAEPETPIDVQPNTVEQLDNAKAGIFTFKEEQDAPVVDKPKEEPKKDDDTDKKETGKDDKTDKKEIDKDYYVSVKPDDVNIKNKRHSTNIIDNSEEGGVNLFDKFLTNVQKETLKIENWKSITSAKAFYDNKGDVIEVKLMNRYAPWGDRKRRYKVTDGESFQVAKQFIEDTKDRIKYE
jgi:hypothetical protein